MKILHVNKFLYRRGGAESYLLDLAARQEVAGHRIAFFSTAHPENEPSEFARFFPPYMELDPPPAGLGDRVRTAAQIVYSRRAERAFDSVLERFGPDVVHVHNIYHHLSPSILRPIRRRRLPAVMTLHDFKLACPTHRFLAGDEVCEACLPRRYYMAPVKRCNQGSFLASSLNALEATVHTALGLYDPIGMFLCPSRFLLDKMRAARMSSDRLRWIPNFIDADAIATKEAPGDGIVYAGRLSREKGVDVLVRAAASVPVDVTIVGDGPEASDLRDLARSVGAERVSFLGHRPIGDVHDRLRGAIASVMPSRGYENLPMAILESFACGTPSIGAAHGGIPELIESDVDGSLFAPGDPEALARALAAAAADPAGWFRRGRAARSKAEERYSATLHLSRLEEAYAEVTARLARASA